MAKRSIDQIKVKAPKSQVLKRSIDSQAANLVQSDPKITEYVRSVDSQSLWTQDITGFTRYKPNEETYYYNPEPNYVFMTNISAQRENDEQVWFIFEIVHSDTAVISRIDPFNYQKVVLEMPEEAHCRKIVSKARFVTDVCVQECGLLGKKIYTEFELSSLKDKHHRVTIVIDLCGYDHSKAADHYDTTFFESRGSFPSFLLTPDPGDYILVENGKDLMLKVKVDISLKTQFGITMILWDWTTKESLQSSAWVRMYNDLTTRIQIEGTNDQDIFTVEIIRSYARTVTLRIISKEASGNRSGKLFFTYTGYSRLVRSKLAPTVDLERTVDIKLPGRPDVFPPHFIYFVQQKRFLCNEQGDITKKEGIQFGKHCTVRCQAFGKHIMALYITKLEPIERPVKLAFYANQDKTVAILDVGRSSSDVEGDYQCVAVNRRGQTTTQDLKLYTSLFTKIKSVELYSITNDTAYISCSVSGDKSMNISLAVSVNGKDQTLLDKDNYVRNVTHRSDNLTMVSLFVPWEDLNYPLNRLVCIANGDRGDDRSEIRLYYQINVYAKVDKYDFKMKKNANGTTSMTCYATGLEPLTTGIYLRKRFYWPGEKRVSDFNETTVTHKLKHRVSMTYTISTQFLNAHKSSLTLYCWASNPFFYDLTPFNVRHHLRYVTK